MELVHLAVKHEHSADGMLSHGNSVCIPCVMYSDTMLLHIIHVHAIKTGAGELDVPKLSEAAERMVQEEPIADDSFYPRGFHRKGIGLLLHEYDIVPHFPQCFEVLMG